MWANLVIRYTCDLSCSVRELGVHRRLAPMKPFIVKGRVMQPEMPTPHPQHRPVAGLAGVP